MARMSEAAGVTAESGESEDAAQRARLPADVEVFRISGPFFFGVAGELLDALKRIGRMPRAIILRMELVPYLDASGVAALREVVVQARANGTRTILAGVQGQPFRLLKRAGLGRSGGAVAYARSYPEALELACIR
jgi:SulP family sulfate permease